MHILLVFLMDIAKYFLPVSWLASKFFITNSQQTHAKCNWAKARRTLVNFVRALVICDKLDWQNFLVCGKFLRCFCHSWQINEISNMLNIWFICHEYLKHCKSSPHTWKFCRSNLSRITSARCKFASVLRALEITKEFIRSKETRIRQKI